MKIAILSISSRPTLPPGEYGYGGMTRVNWWVAEELARLGHDVTMFATPRSVHPSGCGMVTYPSGYVRDNQIPAGEKEENDKNLARWFGATWLSQFDVIHEMSHRHPVAIFCDGPILATMHNPNARNRWGKWTRNLVALSPSHAKLYKSESGKGFVPYVFNGVKLGSQTFSAMKTGSFLLMGVMQPYKGVLETIQAAIEAKAPLVLAGTRGKSLYYKRHCAPLVGRYTYIDFVGEVQGRLKDNLIADAKAAMLFVKWNEPGTMFGVEAMAAGTPIIGSYRGCIPDYVIDSETGFLCKTVDEMALVMQRIDTIVPEACYERYRAHFTVEKQAQSYLKLYERTIAGERW